MTRLPDTYMFIYSYMYVPFRWKGNTLSFREELSDIRVPRLSLAFVEQRCTAKVGGGLRNLQRNKRLPIKRSSIIRVLFTDLRDEVEGSKLGIALREDSDYKRRPRSESVQAPLCIDALRNTWGFAGGRFCACWKQVYAWTGFSGAPSTSRRRTRNGGR